MKQSFFPFRFLFLFRFGVFHQSIGILLSISFRRFFPFHVSNIQLFIDQLLLVMPLQLSQNIRINLLHDIFTNPLPLIPLFDQLIERCLDFVDIYLFPTKFHGTNILNWNILFLSVFCLFSIVGHSIIWYQLLWRYHIACKEFCICSLLIFLLDYFRSEMHPSQGL